MVVIQGHEVRTEPLNPRIITSPVFVVVTAGTARTVDFVNEFGGPAVSCLIDNLDGAQAIRYNINGQSITPINLSASSFRSFDNMSIVSVFVDTTLGPSTVDAVIYAQIAGRATQIGPHIPSERESLT